MGQNLARNYAKDLFFIHLYNRQVWLVPWFVGGHMLLNNFVSYVVIPMNVCML
jgi:6-phosphogluconate dehydrogenase